MATIQFNDDPIDVSEGTQGATWVRTWFSEDIAATDRIDAIAELFTALPDRGTSVPAPLNPNMRVISRRITWIGPLDGPANTGRAKGTLTNSTPVDTITAAPPELGQEDTGSGITLSGRGYVHQRSWLRARLEGSASVSDVQVQWSDGVEHATAIQAPEFGETFTFSRTEQTNPRSRLGSYRGRVNGTVWNGYAVDTVLMQDAAWQTVNGGEYYDVSYTFAVLPLGWTVEITGLDLEKGRVPILAPTANQRRKYVPYDRADFGPLNIVL